jgi:hypothetical protein
MVARKNVGKTRQTLGRQGKSKKITTQLGKF